MHNIVANNNINMSLDFGADDPDIERTLSFLLGNRFRTDERQRVVSQYWFSDFKRSSNSNLHILLTHILPQLAKLTRLQELNASGCNELDPYLPPKIGNLCHLAMPTLSEFHKLRSHPKEIFYLSCLKQLTLRGCWNLNCLPVEVGKLTALEDLNLGNCNSLTCRVFLQKSAACQNSDGWAFPIVVNWSSFLRRLVIWRHSHILI